MTLSLEAIGLILTAIGLGFAWVRGAVINVIKLMLAEMRVENLRALAEFRKDADERYVGKGEWVEHIKNASERQKL